MGRAYEAGLQEVGDGLYAYLQPHWGWGWSNAGLVSDGERSLLIDTVRIGKATTVRTCCRASPSA